MLEGKTMKDVELELVKEEFEETESRVQVVHQSSRSTFVVLGLEVEEMQYVFIGLVRRGMLTALH
jgi:hypothetical protein